MKKTIEDYDYTGKKVIVRCDLNVPIKDGKITDTTRILTSLKTIKYLIEKNAKIIILSHLGKVKSLDDVKKNTLYPVYKRIQELLKTTVYFSKSTRGKELEDLVGNLKEGEVLLVENTRYEDYPNKYESNCDENLSKYWASLADIFINDAYGTCHRCHASNVGIAKYLPSAIGFLIQDETEHINNILNEDSHPFTLIMGGKKISDKTLAIKNLIDECDKLLLGGGMCFTFLKAKGFEIGKSIVDNDNILYCKNILNEYSEKIFMPLDIVTKEGEIKDLDKLNSNDIGYDIGPKTIKMYQEILSNSKRVIINGPMGVYEEKPFYNGTKALYETLRDNNIKTLIGGGDSAASVNALGFNKCFYHISTGGGATLEYLSGKELPGIEVIDNK